MYENNLKFTFLKVVKKFNFRSNNYKRCYYKGFKARRYRNTLFHFSKYCYLNLVEPILKSEL